MAESAVRCLVDKLERLLGKEDDLSRSLYGKEVGRIRNDFETTSPFLRSEENRADLDGQKSWAKQVREIAQQIQDSYDESVGDGFISFLAKTSRFVKHLKARYQLAVMDGMRVGLSSDFAINGARHPQLKDLPIEEALFSEKKALMSNVNLESTAKNLLASYYDLSFYLKACVLYFSLFPKGYKMRRSRLIRLWVAEGFVVSSGEDKPVEEVAEDYMKNLINRNLIKVAEQTRWGTVATCRIHDLLHAIVVSKSLEENFSMSSAEPNKRPCVKIRRLSLYNHNEIGPEYESYPRLRSLVVGSYGSIRYGKSLLANCRLLRVVDLQNVPIQSFPDVLTNLVHLRYLSLQRTGITELPKSIGKLTNLQTLDLKHTMVHELPVEIVELCRLRHLLLYTDSFPSGGFPTGFYVPFNYINYNQVLPTGIGRLSCLQRLAYIDANNDSGMVRELGYLTQLKKLGILKLKRKDGKHLCTSIEKMQRLRSFFVKSAEEDEFIDLHSLSHPPPLLEHLHSIGRLEKLPQWMASLRNLVCIRLISSRLRDDPLKVFQSLPNLVQLTLKKAYDGEELCCEARGYPRLETLDLWFLSKLKKLKVEVGAMSSLQVLDIADCEEFVEMPSYLKSLPDLKISTCRPTVYWL